MENCLCNFMSSYFMRIWGGSIGMMLVLQISEVPSKHFPKAAAGCQFVDGFLQNLWKVHHTSLGGTTHLGCNWKKCRFFLPGPPQMLNKGKTNQSVLLWWQDLVLPQVNCPTRLSLYCPLGMGSVSTCSELLGSMKVPVSHHSQVQVKCCQGS